MERSADDNLNRAGFSAPKGKQQQAAMTAADIESVHKLAYEEGLEEGKEQGYQIGLEQGLAEGRAKVEAEKAKFSQMIRSLIKPIADEKEKIKVALFEIISTFVSEIVKREMILDKTLLMDMIKDAVDCLDINEKVVSLSVSSSDYEAVLALVKQLPEYNESWKIKRHASLSEGAMMIQAGPSRIEMNLADILKEMLERFYQDISDSLIEPK